MKYFSIRELSASPTAKRLGIDNTPNQEQIQNLNILGDKCLDPIREAFGAPIIVSSGFRCDALNQALKGSLTSEHKSGRAADLDSHDNQLLWAAIVSGDFKWTQLINEYPDENGYPSWIHISYNPNDLKCEILRCDNGNYTKIERKEI